MPLKDKTLYVWHNYGILVLETQWGMAYIGCKFVWSIYLTGFKAISLKLYTHVQDVLKIFVCRFKSQSQYHSLVKLWNLRVMANWGWHVL